MQNSQNASTPKLLTDPSQAYIAPDYGSKATAVSNSTIAPRDPPHFKLSVAGLQKMQNMLSSNATLKQIADVVTANPNALLSNKTIVAAMLAANKELQDLGYAVPEGHSAWGTEISVSDNVQGGFAQQYISPGLNLGSTPNEDKTLYAPTLTLPQPCPIEVSTRYWYSAGSNTNYAEVRIWDFHTWSWTNVYFSDTDTTYVFNANTARPYYEVEIQYWPQQDVWDAYIWNRNINNWELMYQEPYGYSDFWQTHRLWDGWDQFEAISPGDNGYDNSFAGVNIHNPIESSNLMIYWLKPTYSYGWDYASGSTGCWTLDNWGQSSNTPFAQAHYFGTQYSDWVVRDPMIYVAAWDPGTYDGNWYQVYTNVYIDGVNVGQAGNSFDITQNVQHTITVDYTSSSYQNYFYGGYEQFWYWDSSNTITLSGSDSSLTAYYYLNF